MHVGKVNGKDLHAEYFVIENVSHMIRGAVMNGIKYGDEVFDKLANSLMSSNARIPAPLSHPSDEQGNFVDANDPITFPSHNIGAFDTDWRVNGDKLMSNTYIPADSINNPRADNKWLSERVNNKQAIDRSTGLYLNIDDTITGYGIDGEPFDGDVTEIFELNHSAILNPDIEPGAKNNGEGVGMFTNAKGDKIDVDEFDMVANASTPAMQLPLAPNSYVFDESKALVNIKTYTNSSDKPSTSYRKFFLNFDQDNVDSFDSYTNLFADVIDGVPHAVKSQVSNIDNDHAKSYANRFNNEMPNNNQSFVKRVLNKIFTAVGGEQTAVNESDFVYRSESGKLHMQQYNCVDGELSFMGEPIEVIKIANEYQPITNNKGSIMDKAQLIATLVSNGISANADMSEAELQAALNTALSIAKPVVGIATDDAIATLTKTVNSLQASITANSSKDLDVAVASVVAMNKGIDEATAKAMGLTACNSFLAANGNVAVNTGGYQHRVNASQSLTDVAMPVFGEK